MSFSRKKCCVPGCIESGRSHQTMHQFPNPLKDIERFNNWVLAIGGDIIGLTNEDVYLHRSVCHAHFEEKFCCRNNRISNIAVPTLMLPGPLSLPKFTFGERRPMRPIQSLAPSTSAPTTTSVPAQKSHSDTILKENKDPGVVQPTLEPGPRAKILEPAMKAPPQLTQIDKESHKIKSAACVKKILKKHVHVTSEEHKLYKKLLNNKKCLKRPRK